MGGSFLEEVTGRTGLLDATPLELAEPELGGHTLEHDAGFDALDGALCQIRDTINVGIDALNQAGLGLRKLPEGSLEELLVMPLTGDYRRIRQNALATAQFRDALHTYSGNATLLSLAASPAGAGRPRRRSCSGSTATRSPPWPRPPRRRGGAALRPGRGPASGSRSRSRSW